MRINTIFFCGICLLVAGCKRAPETRRSVSGDKSISYILEDQGIPHDWFAGVECIEMEYLDGGTVFEAVVILQDAPKIVMVSRVPSEMILSNAQAFVVDSKFTGVKDGDFYNYGRITASGGYMEVYVPVDEDGRVFMYVYWASR